MARQNTVHRHPTTWDSQTPYDSAQERFVSDREWEMSGTWPGGFEPTVAVWPEEESGAARVSWSGSVGLILGVVGVCAALTGLLAPEGAAVGVLGLLISIGGVVAARRPAVAGRGVAAFGGFLALVAVAQAVTAISGRYSWPNSRTDEISRWHTWLVGQWTWLARW